MKRLLACIGVPYIIFISIYLLGLWLIQYIGIPTSNPPPESVGDFVYTVLFTSRGGYRFLHSLLLIQLAILAGRALAGLTRDEGIFSFILFSGLLLLGLISLKVLAVETMTYFLIGMVLQSVFGRNLKIPIFLGWGGAVVVWGLDHFLMKGAIQVFSYSALVWCTCILGGLWALGDRFSKTTLAQIIAWIGRNSLSILVFHAIFIVSLKPASVWFIKVDSAGWLYSIGSTLFVTALCLLVALISDKIGVSRYLFGTPSFFIPLRQREPQNAPRGRE